MHVCDNRRCVNPNHLKVGTQRDNVMDCIGKGRARGLFEPGYDPRRGWDRRRNG